MTQLRRDKLGFVFQFFNLVPVLDAEENITLPARIAGEGRRRRMARDAARDGRIAERRDHRPAELSGGQQQRVAVARALVSKPAVVFADEPTGNLDSSSSTQVLDLLRRSVDELGRTVITVTHDPRVAAYADRVVLLIDGTVASEPWSRAPSRCWSRCRNGQAQMAGLCRHHRVRALPPVLSLAVRNFSAPQLRAL